MPMAALGVLAPHDRPRATGWVEEMVEFVARIMDAGTAYSTPTGVYLRVRDVGGYGDLVHRDLDDLRASAGARVEVDEAKEDPLDFALWKAAKPDEPSWPSPWGPGRPGWHIECVAMSLGILGDDFDIHGGGNDLVFPHHTNERAEALAVGRAFARHWVHNAMLNIEGTKMSKSLGNYRTVAELLDEHPLNGRAFRLLVLQTHYRKTMEVNAELMASARAAGERLDALARRAAMARGPADASTGAGRELDQAAVNAFRSAMDDDLSTPQAVAVVFDTLRRANVALDEGAVDAPTLAATVKNLAGALGVTTVAVLQVQPLQASVGISKPVLVAGSADQATKESAAIEDLVARRQTARDAKDWATADSLREELSGLGVVVEDTPAGPIWHRQ